MSTLLEVKALTVDYGAAPVVADVSFSLGQEKLGIVGQSGAGKSSVGRALMGMLGSHASVSVEHLALQGREMLLSELARLRGDRLAMILQDARHALNPVMTVGAQIGETLRRHRGLRGSGARVAGLALLKSVHVGDAARVWQAYPHELSGGLGQRAMIAMMLAPDPALLIADEPTSALDIIARERVLAELDGQVQARGMGLILISHDLSLVGRFCDRVLVMREGKVVETLSELDKATHPYTRALLDAAPKLLATP
ncbi:MAG: ABC transporter ATP-binding protein [Alphaproteobacteria bacterium]|nr:ABC transporter ATP-binding protein [Alphaproteobacteria bacterium]|tara:strand:+ start:5394 stop:6158 length:765 start_codon:yes stop_codon:yes gene_type:complete